MQNTTGVIKYKGFSVSIIQTENHLGAAIIAKGKKGAKGTKGQTMRRKYDAINAKFDNSVQRALDRDNSILVAKAEITELKQNTKARRAMFAAARKAKV